MLSSKFLGRSSVPVLCYHNIGGNGVPWESFEAQMRWLKASGVQTLTLAALKQFMAGSMRLAKPSVCLTFDDGFRDLHTRVAPLLKELGFNAVVFVINNRLRPDAAPGTDAEIIAHEAHRAFVLSNDRSAWLSGRELCELVEQGVFEVGSHSPHHTMAPVSAPELVVIPEHWAYASWSAGHRPPPAPQLAPELTQPLWLEDEGRLEIAGEMFSRCRIDLEDSRLELEALAKRPVTALAWPWGKDHPISRRAAQKAGFSQLFTLRRGAVGRGSNENAICRLEVRRHKPLSWLKSRIMLYSHKGLASLYSAVRIG